jgi:hypothetical protein
MVKKQWLLFLGAAPFLLGACQGAGSAEGSTLGELSLTSYAPKAPLCTYRPSSTSSEESHCYLQDVKGDPEELVIPAEVDGKKVVAIGPKAFRGCDRLKKVTLPSTLLTIETSAFEGCSALTSLALPASLTGIFDCAFFGCTALQEMDLPASLENLGNGVFGDCPALAAFSVDVGNTHYASDGRAIYGTPMNSSILISSETYLCAYANASGSEYALPDSGVIIAKNAFQGCSSLKSVTFPSSLREVQDHAFQDCTALTSLSFPASLIRLGLGACQGCSALGEVSFASGSSLSIEGAAFAQDSSLQKVALPSLRDSVSHPQCLFQDCLALREVSLPANLTGLPRDFFKNCPALASVELPSSLQSIDMGAFAGCSALKSLTLPESCVGLGSGLFLGCTSLASFTVAAGNSAFESDGRALFLKGKGILLAYAAASGESYEVSEGVSAIKDAAFAGASQLTHLSLPSSLADFSGRVWTDCSALTSFALADNPHFVLNPEKTMILSSDQSGVLRVAPGLKKVTIPSGVRTLGDFALADSPCLQSVDLPASLTTVGNAAFAYCPQLNKVAFPPALKVIPDGCFYGCTALKRVSIPSSVQFIGDQAFCYCTSLEALSLPQGLKDIPAYLCFHCTALRAVDFPAGLTRIGFGAFACCPSLESAILPDAITLIASMAFCEDSALSSLHLPAQLLTLEASAFAYCVRLTEVRLPASLHRLDGCAFYYCHNLEQVTYEGTKAEWNEIEAFGPTLWTLERFFHAYATNVTCSDGVVAI